MHDIAYVSEVLENANYNNRTSNTQSDRRSISAPHQRCSANSQTIRRGLTTLLVLLLITNRDALLTTSSCYQVNVNSVQDLFNEYSNIFSCISGHPETLVTILLQKSTFSYK